MIDKVLIRMSGWLLFLIMDPFWAYLINTTLIDWLDCEGWKKYLSYVSTREGFVNFVTIKRMPKGIECSTNPHYQHMDKIMDLLTDLVAYGALMHQINPPLFDSIRSAFVVGSPSPTNGIGGVFDQLVSSPKLLALLLLLLLRAIGVAMFLLTGSWKWFLYFPHFFQISYLIETGVALISAGPAHGGKAPFNKWMHVLLYVLGLHSRYIMRCNFTSITLSVSPSSGSK